MAISVALLLAVPAEAETVQDYYYTIHNYDTGILLARGRWPADARLILPPFTRCKKTVFSPSARAFGTCFFKTPTNGRSRDLPTIEIYPLAAGEPDSDSDGLPDIAEQVCGTDLHLADTDGDGITDLQEAFAGSHQDLDNGNFTGTALTTFVAESISDVSVSGLGLAAACGVQGTAFLETGNFSGINVTTRLPTKSQALAVAMGAGVGMIAEAEAGFRCVTLSAERSIESSSYIKPPGIALSVVASGDIGYGGTGSGLISEVDLRSGSVLRELNTGPGDIEDLALKGDWLIARKPDRLLSISLSGADMQVMGELQLSNGRTPGGRLRISASRDSVFCTKIDGLHIVDIANLPAMSLKATVNGPGDNWRHFVANGRNGVLAGKVQVTNNWLLRLPIETSLFSIPEAEDSISFLTRYSMPGFANSVAINRGVAYVGCDNGALAVVNYLDVDRARIAPAITLGSNIDLTAASPATTEGSLMRLTAAATDDVQVSNVEFYVNGVLAFDDGTFSFEHRMLAPRRSAGVESFKVRARAFDTGGNATWSTEYTIALTPDLAPPHVRQVVPAEGSMNLAVSNIHVRFNKWMDEFTLEPPGLVLSEAGADGSHGTGDDVTVPYFMTYRSTDSLARLVVSGTLPRGNYRVSVGTTVKDIAGNAMAAAYHSDFRVYALDDSDGDGLPDDWESLLGTNPALADSDGDGTPDGMEDHDGDGTADGLEVTRLGQDPRVADANGNGVPDGLDDSDSDGFLDRDEALAGTSIHDSDTDGDGLDDGTELKVGYNPLVSNASPTRTVKSAATAVINAIPGTTPPIATPVRSARSEFLNAVPAVTPLIPTPARSGPTSFRNQNPPPP